MKQEKVKIILDRIMERIDNGEFDKDLKIPFASKKMLKGLVESKMDIKLETNSTPILSDNDLDECVKEVRETAAHTASIFVKKGILVPDEDGILGLNPKLEKLLNPKE